MMLFDRNIEPRCAHCVHGTYLGEGEVACVKRGIMYLNGYCNKFKYDPYKRVPERREKPDASKFSEEDFKL